MSGRRRPRPGPAGARPARARPAAGPRRGAALLLVLLMTAALAALALSSVYLASTATLVGKAYDREQDFKYAADAAVAVGKSQLNHDPYALPDTGFGVLLANQRVDAADGQPVPGLTVNVYAGPTGSTTGQFGRFASVVAEARDARGARFVRRLELTQESFARFAYWSNTERQANGTAILFGGGDQLRGPVWSNDVIQITSFNGLGATFWDEVGTARTVSGRQYGTFRKGPPLENQDRIELPTVTKLAKLPQYAAAGRLSFTAPTTGDASAVRTRLEFVALDLNADGDSADADEGFVRAYEAASTGPGGVAGAAWLRGDRTGYNCGDWHRDTTTRAWAFYPHAVHTDTSFTNRWSSSTSRNNGAHRGAAVNDILGVADGQPSNGARWKESGAPAPRCFPGGDPRLAPVDRPDADWPGQSGRRVKRGGDDTTFTRVGRYGTWASWTGAAYAPLTALSALPSTSPRRRNAQEAAALFPLGRAANPQTMGVIYVRGTAAVSGTLRGRVTVYSDASLVVLDDQRYATDPATTDPLRQAGLCADVLGLLAGRDVVVADNAVNTPQATAAGTRAADDSPDLFVHAVIMALSTSFTVEDYDEAPFNAQPCEAAPSGRGCLYLTGGLIQERRGAVGQSGGSGISGFVKRYAYDRCAAVQPPPYFPTTGRFLDNRYYELDPVGFNAARYFASITPRPQ